MLTVQKNVDKLLSFFEHNDTQSFQVSVPVRKGKIVSVFERQKNQDIRTEVQTTMYFTRSSLIAKLYNDEAPKITFITRDIIPRVKTVNSISFEKNYPLSFKAGFTTSLMNFTIKESAIFSTENQDDGYSYGVHTLTQLFSKYQSLRLETIHEKDLIMIDGFFNKFCNIGLNLIYNWKCNKVLEAQAISKFSIRNNMVGVTLGYLDKSIYVVWKRKANERIKLGTMLGIKNIGEEFPSDKVAVVASKYRIDPSASIKCLLNSDMVSNHNISFDFNYKHKDFLRMKFSTTLNPMNIKQKSFGLEILFDLNK